MIFIENLTRNLIFFNFYFGLDNKMILNILIAYNNHI